MIVQVLHLKGDKNALVSVFKSKKYSHARIKWMRKMENFSFISFHFKKPWLASWWQRVREEMWWQLGTWRLSKGMFQHILQEPNPRHHLHWSYQFYRHPFLVKHFKNSKSKSNTKQTANLACLGLMIYVLGFEARIVLNWQWDLW